MPPIAHKGDLVEVILSQHKTSIKLAPKGRCTSVWNWDEAISLDSPGPHLGMVVDAYKLSASFHTTPECVRLKAQDSRFANAKVQLGKKQKKKQVITIIWNYHVLIGEKIYWINDYDDVREHQIVIKVVQERNKHGKRETQPVQEGTPGCHQLL